MLKDSRSYEVQIIDAVRSVNKALGGTYGTSSAIYKSEFNQYEVQLIDAIKGIGRTLSSKGLSLVGGGVGEVTAEQFQALSQRVTKLEQESFFRLVDGNVTLKEQYQNLWVPGWLASGGIGNGHGGGGGVTLLSELEDVSIDTSTLANGHVLTWDATAGDGGMWVNAPSSGGGGSGTVTGIKMNGTTLSPAVTGIVDLGTVITSLSGYATEQWVGQQGFLTSAALNGYATESWVQQQGYLTSFTETDPTVPAWAKASQPALYIGTTRVQTTETPQDLTGILSVKATASALSQFVWDGGHNAWHFLGNLYATGWVSSGDIGSGGGGGGSSTLEGLNDVNISSPTPGQALVYRSGEWVNETIQAGGGTVTSVKVGSTTYNPVSGVVSLPAYPTTLPASDVYSWAKESNPPSYSLSDISGTSDLQAIEALSGTSGLLKKTGSNSWSLDTTTYLSSHQTIYSLSISAGSYTGGSTSYTPNSASKSISIPTTLDHISDGSNRKLSDYVTLATTQNNISGEKTFTSKPVHIASSSGIDVNGSSYIDIGEARLKWDANNHSLRVMTKPGSNYSGDINLYADGDVGAGGPASGSSVRYVNCASQNAYDNLSSYDPATMYTIGSAPSFSRIYLGTIRIY